MKKIALVLTLALPFVFASCGNDDDLKDIVLDHTTLSVNYDQSVKLGSSEKNCTYVSNNTYVATVDKDGNIEGEHVGEAVITVTKEGYAPAQCVVTVKATNNNFELPILKWNSNVDEVKGLVGSSLSLLDEDKTDGVLLTYGNADYAFPWYQYNFTSDKLDASSIVMDSQMSIDKDLIDFLEQRYEEAEETDTGWVYLDAENRTNANLQITVVYDSENSLVTTVWQPVEHVTKAGYDSNVAMKMHNHAKSLRK